MTMMIGKAGEATGSAYITKQRGLAAQLSGQQGRGNWLGRGAVLSDACLARHPVGCACRYRKQNDYPASHLALRPFTAYPVTGNVC
jgi:hypothetical protein